MYLYPIFYDLIAETPEEKELAAQLHLDIVYYILKNDYYLIDADGKPTTWGDWNPDDLNNDPYWVPDRGINALEMLAFILGAYKLRQDPQLLEHFNRLAFEDGYAENMLNQKITSALGINHADDELSIPSYFLMWWAIKDLNGTFDEFYSKYCIQVERQVDDSV
jgi:hypothetical protein